MSLDAVIGRIDQIVALQQQVTDPTSVAVAATSAAATGSTAASSTSASSSSSFADMLSSAEEQSALSEADGTGDSDTDALTGTSAVTDSGGSGLSDALLQALQGTTGTTGTTALTGTTGLTGTTTTDTADPSTQVQSMVDEANSLVGKPYVWGGGHSGWGEQTGYDCSGFVSAVLHAGGYLSSPQDTQTLPDQAGIENGPGQYVTIYDRTDAGVGNDHVIIDLGGQFYESGGGSGAWGGGGGVEKIGTPSAAYLASFNRTLHPEGL
jgi:cell wall-associated NlpC family hydrolase